LVVALEQIEKLYKQTRLMLQRLVAVI